MMHLQHNNVFFSLLFCDATQITAAEMTSGSRVSVYTEPCVQLLLRHKELQGYHIIYVNNDRDMSVNGQALVCETIDSAIIKL